MSYPNYPENRLIVDGVDLSVRYQLILLDGYTLSPPEPKTYTVDVPGGDGVIDLTQALTGDVAYSNRKQDFTFLVVDTDNFEKVKTEVSNFLHGKAFDYNMTMDPEYTYHGRFTVTEYQHQVTLNHGIVGAIKIEISADPYKVKTNKVYALNATGGAMFRLPSGRKPVHPVIESSLPCRVRFGNVITDVPAGTHRLNDILFKEGYNEIYVNSYRLYNVTWDELKRIHYIPIGSSNQYAENLVDNFGFERGNFEQWVVDPTWAGAVVNDFQPHGGTYKALLSTPTTSYATIKSNSFETKENHTYEVSCWINSDKDTTLKIGLYCGGLLEQPYVYITKPVSILGDVGNWKKVSVNIVTDTTFPDSRLSIGFSSAIVDENHIRIDDCSVVDVTDKSKDGLTWGDAKSYRWDDLQRLKNDIYNIPRRWSDLGKYRWLDIYTKRWMDIDYRVEDLVYTDTPKTWKELGSHTWNDLSRTPWSDISYTRNRRTDTTVYITYDWKDL